MRNPEFLNYGVPKLRILNYGALNYGIRDYGLQNYGILNYGILNSRNMDS